MWNEEVLKNVIGKVPTKIERIDDHFIDFYFGEDEMLRMYHAQDCCECVTIEDVSGDLQNLVGHPILVFDERYEHPEEEGKWYESQTYTFYTIRSVGGTVDIRWYGTSNGYYSETVDFKMGDPETVKKQAY